MKPLISILILAITLAAATSPSAARTQESADASFAEGEWKDAADAYRVLLKSDQENASNWFNLGAALHQLENFPDALVAYQKALALNYQPEARVRYRLARVYMSLDREEDALKELEALAASGGQIGRVIANTAEFEPLLNNARFQAVVRAMTPCTAPPFQHFNFWLGEWDVSAPGDPNIKSSKITSIQNGCAVLEEYSTPGGFTGISINFYDQVREIWNQTWISNVGGAVYLQGGLNDEGAMVMTDADLAISKASGTINRVTWSIEGETGVRQYWETSSDEGKTWTVSFDGHYTPKAPR